MAEKEYQRLTRTGSRSAFELISLSRASLWLGKDHLLCVESNSYSEDYKRFYFRDIQAIIIRENSARNVRSFIYGGLAMLFLVVGLAVGNTIALVALSSAAGISLVVAAINFQLGPTCSCQIRTAVQTESLPIIRVRRARNFLERIRPLIAEAQGQLTAEDITARMQQVARAGAATNQTSAPAQTVAPSQESNSSAGNVPSSADDPNAPPRMLS